MYEYVTEILCNGYAISGLVGLLKYVTDFQKITLEEIGKNAKYVIKLLNLI